MTGPGEGPPTRGSTIVTLIRTRRAQALSVVMGLALALSFGVAYGQSRSPWAIPASSHGAPPKSAAKNDGFSEFSLKLLRLMVLFY